MSSFEDCFRKVVFDLDVQNVPCIKLLIAKVLGYAIIVGSVTVKVPQIIKVVAAKSAEGIDIVSQLLELTSLTSSLVYGYANGFPFSAYGDNVFMTFQVFALAFLTFYYQGNTQAGMMLSAVYAGILSFLLSPMAPLPLLWFMQAMVVPNILIGRFLQAFRNFQNKSTGQLSSITTFAVVLGSLARIFTSYQETGDSTLILTCSVSFICNCIIMGQILYYGNASTKQPSPQPSGTSVASAGSKKDD